MPSRIRQGLRKIFAGTLPHPARFGKWGHASSTGDIHGPQPLLITGASFRHRRRHPPALPPPMAGTWRCSPVLPTSSLPLADEIGDAALALPCDVTEREQTAAAIDRAAEQFRHARCGVRQTPARACPSPGSNRATRRKWHDMIHLNILAVLYAAHCRDAVTCAKPRAISSSPAPRRAAIT